MRKKTIYFCEICGGSSASRTKILKCEQSHNTTHIYPIGTVVEFHPFGHRCNGKEKGKVVEQTYNKGYAEPHYWVIMEKNPYWMHRRYPIHCGYYGVESGRYRILVSQSWIERVVNEKKDV
jgi:hypothetical protein